jgi:hypothetical protein
LQYQIKALRAIVTPFFVFLRQSPLLPAVPYL